MDTKARIYINKYMRMFVCFCAALFLMLWTPRITAWADGGSQNGVNWSCDGSSLWVSGATIPTVGRTSYPWYRYVSGVTYINVDVNGGIGDNAFYQCYKARTIDIGGNVSYIGTQAFYGIGGNGTNQGTTNVYMRYNGAMSFGTNPFYAYG